MSDSIFAGLTEEADIGQETDQLGGFSVLDSGVYGFSIKYAFVTFSTGKAMCLNVHFEGESNQSLRQQLYMTSGEAKGCKNFYEKNGVKHYLPGYNMANALCLLTVGKQINQLSTKKAVINIYDPALMKEAPTEVDMLIDILGKKVLAGVIKQTVDKRAKNPSSGTYEPTGETRDENELDKLFHIDKKLTVPEARAKATEPVFYNKWKEKWDGQVKDKTSKDAGKAGGIGGKPPVTGEAAGAGALFG